MGQTPSVTLANESQFDVEVTLQGDGHMVASGRQIAIQLKDPDSERGGTYRGGKGVGRIRVTQQGTVVREMTFEHDKDPDGQRWTLKDDGLRQHNGFVGDYYYWTYVKK